MTLCTKRTAFKVRAIKKLIAAFCLYGLVVEFQQLVDKQLCVVLGFFQQDDAKRFRQTQ